MAKSFATVQISMPGDDRSVSENCTPRFFPCLGTTYDLGSTCLIWLRYSLFCSTRGGFESNAKMQTRLHSPSLAMVNTADDHYQKLICKPQPATAFPSQRLACSHLKALRVCPSLARLCTLTYGCSELQHGGRFTADSFCGQSWCGEIRTHSIE